MKLQCQVDVVNRLLAPLNIRSTGNKYLKSTLAIGREPKNDQDYFIIHFSTSNKTGVKYKVLKNIKQVFVKCIEEGKATIRFIEPPNDLCIKSDSLQLKNFLKTLKCCLSGDVNELKLLNLSNISVTAKNSAPTKLIIRDRSEFPAKGLPRTLEKLTINGIKLCNFRREILLLRHLKVLDLSNNEIEKLPAELGRMPAISELNLANNKLGVHGTIDWKWLFGEQLSKSLRLLDLSGNVLGHLPDSVWKLTGLITLNVNNNMLESLPSSLGRNRALRYLTVSQNELKSLPCSLMQCNLDYIDLSGNKFHTQHDHSKISARSPWDLYVGNLVRLASIIVLKCRVHYASNIIPYTLVNFLDNSELCVCGVPVLDKSVYMCKKFVLKDYFSSVIFDSNRDDSVYFDCYFCSAKCHLSLNRY